MEKQEVNTPDKWFTLYTYNYEKTINLIFSVFCAGTIICTGR